VLKDWMLDIETLGTEHLPVILQVGAQNFDAKTGQFGQGFEWTMTDEGQTGMFIELRTVRWWMKQSQEARDSAFGSFDNCTSIEIAMRELASLTAGARHVYAKGTQFDLDILNRAYNRFGSNDYDDEGYGVHLFHFSKWRDCRTHYDMLGQFRPARTGGAAHTALADARYQAEVVVECYRRFGNGNR
jgi:hypothetical protein